MLMVIISACPLSLLTPGYVHEVSGRYVWLNEHTEGLAPLCNITVYYTMSEIFSLPAEAMDPPVSTSGGEGTTVNNFQTVNKELFPPAEVCHLMSLYVLQ